MVNLTKAQKCVLTLIFEDKKTEEEALEEAKVARPIYDGWFRQALWLKEYEHRIMACKRTSDLIITTFKEVAATKLVTLTNCEKEDVARKACLDIIEREIKVDEITEIEKEVKLKPRTQEKIMEIMANDETGG